MMAMVTLATVMIKMMDDNDNDDKFYGVCVSLMTEVGLPQASPSDPLPSYQLGISHCEEHDFFGNRFCVS